MKHWIVNTKHVDIHYPCIFKNSHKQEIYFNENITNNKLNISKHWLPLKKIIFLKKEDNLKEKWMLEEKVWVCVSMF